jgi:hypothetical protein
LTGWNRRVLIFSKLGDSFAISRLASEISAAVIWPKSFSRRISLPEVVKRASTSTRSISLSLWFL